MMLDLSSPGLAGLILGQQSECALDPTSPGLASLILGQDIP
jgi:hypothetical protein